MSEGSASGVGQLLETDWFPRLLMGMGEADPAQLRSGTADGPQVSRVAGFWWVLAATITLVLIAQGPAVAQDPIADDAILPAELSWLATKTETIVEPPLDLPPVPVGVEIDGVLAVTTDCTATPCRQLSAISVWPQTPFEEVPEVAWERAGTSWALAGEGTFISASYPDGTTCVYLRTERWEVEAVEAVFDGENTVITRLEGVFERADVLDVGRSFGDVARSCPPYEARDLWSVVATSDVAAAPPPEPTPGSEAADAEPSIGHEPPEPATEPAADPQAAIAEPGPASSGTNTTVIALIVGAVIVLAGGTAVRIWMGSWWGTDGCTSGAKRNCTVTRIFLLPYDEDLDAVDKFNRNVGHVSDFAKTIAIVSMVMNPSSSASAMPLTAARAAQSATIFEELSNAFQRGRDQQVDRLGWDVYVEVTWQCCKPGAIRGTFWEDCRAVVLIPPPDSIAAMDRTDNSGWKSTLPTTEGLIDMLNDEINRLAPAPCANCC